jgi:putative polyketide hydroxylase
MNTGIQDAHNVAWKLADVLHGWARPTLLETYERERQPVARFNIARSLENFMMVGQIAAAGDRLRPDRTPGASCAARRPRGDGRLATMPFTVRRMAR